MLGSLLAAALLVGGAAPAERTPDGPATLISAWTAPADQADGSVLTSLTVKVGAGGRAGVVRPLVGGVAGDPIDLPATPGTYTFPVRHVRLAAPLGLVQEAGGLAIMSREACRPTIARSLDPCETRWVDIQRTGQGTTSDRGAQLAISFNTEPTPTATCAAISPRTAPTCASARCRRASATGGCGWT